MRKNEWNENYSVIYKHKKHHDSDVGSDKPKSPKK